MTGADFGRGPAEQRAAEAEDRRQTRPIADLRLDRLEPALDAAVQRVVVDALVMRLMRLAGDGALGRHRIDRVAAAPVAAALGPGGVQGEILPAPGGAVPGRHPARPRPE